MSESQIPNKPSYTDKNQKDSNKQNNNENCSNSDIRQSEFLTQVIVF